MPTFLPLTAISRSQRIRIAGQTLTPGKISYIDLGIVDVPGTATLTKGATKTGTLTESKWYGYVITAVDANGGETTASIIKAVETVAEAEPSVGLTWTAIAHAKKYRVYANATTGAASEAAAEVATLKLIGEPEAAAFTDTGQTRKATVPPITNTTSYNVGGVYSTHKELQAHFAIGAVQQLGGYTPSNLDYVAIDDLGWELKLESEKIKVVKSVVRQRSTGRVLPVTNELETSGVKSGGASKTQLAIVVFNTQTGKLETLTATEKTVEEPTAAEFATLVEEKVTKYHEILWVIVAKIKVLTNKTSTYLKGAQTPTLGDSTDFPAVALVP